jgi:DNA transformation protein
VTPPPRGTPAGPDTPVEELWNLSATTGAWLREVGVRTHADLERADLLDVWRQLKLSHRQVTRLMYYALWGAREDQHWQRIPDSEKERLERYAADEGL